MPIYKASEFWDEHDFSEFDDVQEIWGPDPIKTQLRGDVMFKKDVKVEAFWDEEAKVWVASSDDVPGLITEAATMELLIQKIRILIPELFRANNIVTDEETIDIPVYLLSRWQEVIKFQAQNG